MRVFIATNKFQVITNRMVQFEDASTGEIITDVRDVSDEITDEWLSGMAMFKR